MPDDEQYQPRMFWESRLGTNFSLRGVGHIGFGESYNRWLYRRKAAVIESLFRGVDLRGKSVLDIGCGTGFFVDWYFRRGAHVSGLDITEVSIRELSKRFPDCTFQTQDITDFKYTPQARFDLVNMWDVIYHIVDDAALGRALDNISKSLTDGGLFLLTDWLGARRDIQIAPHVKVRSLTAYQKLLGERGFVCIKVKPLFRALSKVHVAKLDNHLAWLYYLCDMLTSRPSSRNLSVALWRKQG